MAIPTPSSSLSISAPPPPPLPPPRRISDLENGYDTGWDHANSSNNDNMNNSSTSSSKLPSIKPGSSLLGNNNNQQAGSSDQSDLLDEPSDPKQSDAKGVDPPSPGPSSVDEGRPRSSLSISTNFSGIM